MNSPPRKEAETGLHAVVWRKINQILDYMKEITPQHGRGIKTTRKPNGTTIEVDLPEAAQSGSVLNQYIVKEIFGDYYRCRSFVRTPDGTSEGDEDVFVARPFRHRQSLFDGQSIDFSSDGDVYTATYAYDSPTMRIETIGGVDERQIIVPIFKLDFDVIHAMASEESMGVVTADDEPVTLLDVNQDGRAWARANQH